MNLNTSCIRSGYEFNAKIARLGLKSYMQLARHYACN